MKPEQDSRSDASHADASQTWLSALADGDAQAAEAACRLWRDDEEARRSWHRYHLIGDVLRSGDLASAPGHDAAFMAELRKRLASEPVVLAPGATVPRQRPWLVPAAMAAGFVLVAGVLVLLRGGLPLSPGASVEVATARSASGAGPLPGQLQTRQVAAGQALITDARLDEFLRAHQAAGAGMAAATPGGNLRRVEALVPAPADR